VRARHVLAGLALVLQASCVAVFGVPDEEAPSSAVADICICDRIPDVERCKATFGDRLDHASAATRTAWLTKYTAECSDSCAKRLLCLREVPTCSLIECSIDEECCLLGSSTKATCVDHACHQG
jgi:hypothetical protein